MNRRAVSASLLATGAACLAVAASGVAGGGGPAPTEWSINLAVKGPGTLTVGSISLRDTSFLFTTISSDEVLNPVQDGNDAEFRGWVGECAPVLGPCGIGPGGINAGSLTQGAMSLDGSRCRWTAALFAFPGEPTPTVANPCETPGGGGGSGPGGGGSGTGGGSGSGSAGGTGGGVAPLPAAGTALQGGVTVVRKAPALAGARTTAKAGTVRATGRYPGGTTRMAQSLLLASQSGVAVAGKCRITRSEGTFSCTAKPPKGRWRVITQAKRGSAVIAQSSVIVTVR